MKCGLYPSFSGAVRYNASHANDTKGGLKKSRALRVKRSAAIQGPMSKEADRNEAHREEAVANRRPEAKKRPKQESRPRQQEADATKARVNKRPTAASCERQEAGRQRRSWAGWEARPRK